MAAEQEGRPPRHQKLPAFWAKTFPSVTGTDFCSVRLKGSALERTRVGGQDGPWRDRGN